jgi:hypothetical protein
MLILVRYQILRSLFIKCYSKSLICSNTNSIVKAYFVRLNHFKDSKTNVWTRLFSIRFLRNNWSKRSRLNNLLKIKSN